MNPAPLILLNSFVQRLFVQSLLAQRLYFRVNFKFSFKVNYFLKFTYSDSLNSDSLILIHLLYNDCCIQVIEISLLISDVGL